MKDFFQILKRFIPPYKKQLILNFLFNLLSALFTVFSVTMMIPILDILFDQSKAVHDILPWEINLDVAKHNLSYYITLLKIRMGQGLRFYSSAFLLF